MRLPGFLVDTYHAAVGGHVVSQRWKGERSCLILQFIEGKTGELA